MDGTLLGLLLVLACLWLLAIFDMVLDTRLEPVQRIIVVALLIFLAPVGMLAWLLVRGGRHGPKLVAAAVALTVVLAFVVLAGVQSQLQPTTQSVGPQLSVPRAAAPPQGP
jgi:hypothetical protein